MEKHSVNTSSVLQLALADQRSPAVSQHGEAKLLGTDTIRTGDLGRDKAGVEVKNEVGGIKPERKMRLGKRSVSQVHSVEM